MKLRYLLHKNEKKESSHRLRKLKCFLEKLKVNNANHNHEQPQNPKREITRTLHSQSQSFAFRTDIKMTASAYLLTYLL